jgi:hypothetical protein
MAAAALLIVRNVRISVFAPLRVVQLVLEDKADITIGPHEILRNVLKDGDEVFVSIASKPKWNAACT